MVFMLILTIKATKNLQKHNKNAPKLPERIVGLTEEENYNPEGPLVNRALAMTPTILEQ